MRLIIDIAEPLEPKEVQEALEKQVAKEHKNYRCPRCTTWNKAWILREQTILKYNMENKNEAVFCWHCGQKVRIGEE